MILLSVGTQLPFDRLVKAVDIWCGDNESHDITAQIARVNKSSYIPVNMHWKMFFTASEMDAMVMNSDFIIAHAGMGSIISALSYSKPIIIMPRLFKFNEHRNDHQVGTAERFSERQGIYLAHNGDDLNKLLNEFTSPGASIAVETISARADDTLISGLYDFIHK